MGYFDSEDDNQQSMASSFQNSGDAFADVNNLDHCIKYLNQTLTTYGFPSSLNLHSNEPASIAQACNCIYALLQQRQRDIDFRGAAEDQKQRVMSDMTRLEAKVERQDAQLTAKERELASLTSKVQKGAVSFRAQLEKVQHERDEFQRLVVSTQQVRVQQSHELKKKEKEYVKLQEKLNQVLTEKKKETKPGLEIMNLLQKEGRQRGTWNSKKADGDFYKMIVDAYEAKKQELMAENTDLRALLRSMQLDMRDFLNAPNALIKTNSLNGSFELEQPSTPQAGSTDVFDLPFHMARDQIEQSLRAKMTSIKERMIQVQEAQKGPKSGTQASDRELELEAQLVEARSIISEQASLMGKHLIEDPRTYGITQMASEMELSEAHEDSVETQEHADQQLEEVSAMQKMVAESHREPNDMDIAKRRVEKQLWPENQNAKPENANIGSETHIIYAEMEGPSEAPKPQVSEQQTGGSESLQILQDNENKSIHSQKSLSIGFTSNETLESCSGNVNLLVGDRNQTAPQDRPHVWLEIYSSGCHSSGAIYKPMYTESASERRCNGGCILSENPETRTYEKMRSSSVQDEVAKPEMQVSALGTRTDFETQPVVGESCVEGRSWSDCGTQRASNHTQIIMQSEHLERKRSCSKAPGQDSLSQRTSSDLDTPNGCPHGVISWTEFSSPRSSHQSSQGDFDRCRPVFQFIVHDAWLEESQGGQDGVSQLDALVPFEMTLSQRAQLKTWMETKSEDGQCHIMCTHSHELHRQPGEVHTEEQVSCFCFHLPSLFFAKKKHGQSNQPMDYNSWSCCLARCEDDSQKNDPIV